MVLPAVSVEHLRRATRDAAPGGAREDHAAAVEHALRQERGQRARIGPYLAPRERAHPLLPARDAEEQVPAQLGHLVERAPEQACVGPERIEHEALERVQRAPLVLGQWVDGGQGLHKTRRYRGRVGLFARSHELDEARRNLCDELLDGRHVEAVLAARDGDGLADRGRRGLPALARGLDAPGLQGSDGRERRA